MSVEVLKVTGDYKVITSQISGSKTVLNTPRVEITGDLLVQGTTTTVESTVTTIADNVITLNEGETGPEISALHNGFHQSGIEIDRGPSSSSVTFVYNDDETYTQPNGGTSEGIFQFKIGSSLLGIQTHHIETTGEDLTLLGANAPTAVLTVRGTSNYENQITDDDDIPNKKYVDNAIINSQIAQIAADNTLARVEDADQGATYSRFWINIDGVQRFEVNQNTIELGEIIVDGTTIRPETSGSSLFLESNGSGEVVIRDVLSIEGAVSPTAPSADSGRIKLYSQAEAEGGSGLYFVNTSSTRDELVSKKKALLYSMLF